MKKFLLLSLFFIFSSQAFTVSTRFISDLKFNRISAFSFSNISFYKDGSITLSPAVSTLYKDNQIIWSFARYKNKNYLGTGDKATLIEWDGKKRRKVYQDTNATLISEILHAKNTWILSQIPDNHIYFLNENFDIVQKIQVTNQYVWEIVPYKKGFFILGGNPAALSFVEPEKKQSQILALLPEEDHLLKGILSGKDLFFSSESTLYLYSKGKVKALVSFEQPLADFTVSDGVVYLITSSTRESAKSASSAQSLSSKQKTSKQKRNLFVRNALYRFVPGESLRLLAEQKGFTFLSLDKLGNRLIIGTDKDGGYFTYSLANQSLAYASLGEGSFMKMFREKDGLFGILIYPSRLVRFKRTYAASGWIQSDIQDTGNISLWGKAVIQSETPPGTFVHLHTRSGAIENTDYWDDWIAAKDQIRSLPNRYLQYRLNLGSDGSLSPKIRGIRIPFVQKNLPPLIKEPVIDYQEQGVKISWTLEDPNNDRCQISVFLRNENNEEILLTPFPLQTDSYTLHYNRFASGKYRLRIVASDSPSNPENSAQSFSFLTPLFHLDSDAPVISNLTTQKQEKNSFFIRFSAKDALLPIGHASYSLNGQKPLSLLPSDGIFDEESESFRFQIKSKTPVFISVQVSDQLGNTASKGIWIR